MTPEQIEQERARFETWLANCEHPHWGRLKGHYHHLNGEYIYSDVNDMWAGWLAHSELVKEKQ